MLDPTVAAAGPSRPPAGTTADPPGRWPILWLLALSQLLGMSVWFAAGATSAQLADLWSLSPRGSALLTTLVQIGFVAGTALAALLNLADLVPARRYLAVSAVCAAIANGAMLVAPGPLAAYASRFLTGFFLAGVYPPAMKMAATWFRASRGLAIGLIVGALTVGKALPFLIGALTRIDYRIVVSTTSAGALAAGALIAIGYRDGPFPFPARPFSFRLVGTIVRHRATRLAILGYLGHMWELYAMWALVALFLADVFAAGPAPALAAVHAALTAFVVIAAGGVGSLLAGVWADRLGRERVTIASMAVSGSCALVIGHLVHAPIPLVLALAIVWGFAIVADSAQFSALVTEHCPPHAVGTALTLQVSLGFLLTAFMIWFTAAVAARIGWGIAFGMLAIGPALGILAMARLKAASRQA